MDRISIVNNATFIVKMYFINDTIILICKSYIPDTFFSGIVAKQCSSCYGRGYRLCYDCNGYGKIECEECNGKGMLEKMCEECDGNGKY